MQLLINLRQIIDALILVEKNSSRNPGLSDKTQALLELYLGALALPQNSESESITAIVSVCCNAISGERGLIVFTTPNILLSSIRRSCDVF